MQEDFPLGFCQLFRTSALERPYAVWDSCDTKSRAVAATSSQGKYAADPAMRRLLGTKGSAERSQHDTGPHRPKQLSTAMKNWRAIRNCLSGLS